MRAIPHKAADRAKQICRNDTHGYNNAAGERLGHPDFACSSFVAACYRYAGVNVPANSYTQSMKQQWKPHGFRNVADQVNLRTGEGLRVGDIVLAPGRHVEIVVTEKTHRLAGARGNPRSTRPENGHPGDQTGREISVRKYYDDGWSICLRYSK